VAIIKKSRRKAAPQPELDLLKAVLEVVSVEEQLEPEEKTAKDGSTFTAEPNVNLELLVVDDGEDGEHDGEKFFDRFKLKEEDGVWTVREGTKLGNLVEILYGGEFFEDEDMDFNPEDLNGFQFVATVKPRKNPKTNNVYGSMVDYESIREYKKKKAKGGAAA
jgi:hypothetical protein